MYTNLKPQKHKLLSHLHTKLHNQWQGTRDPKMPDQEFPKSTMILTSQPVHCSFFHVKLLDKDSLKYWRFLIVISFSVMKKKNKKT